MKWSTTILALVVKALTSKGTVPTGSPSRGGDVAVYAFDINQPGFHTPFFYSVLVPVFVFMAVSTVFCSLNSPDNPPLFLSVLPVLYPPCWSFQLSRYESLLQPWYKPLWLTRLKALTNLVTGHGKSTSGRWYKWTAADGKVLWSPTVIFPRRPVRR